MLELVGGIFLGIGVIALLGACLLLFYTGMQLTRAIEIHSDTMSAIIALRENTQKDYQQIQEWIELMNTNAGELELKATAMREFCARGFIDMEKKVQAIEKSFSEMSNVNEKFLN